MQVSNVLDEIRLSDDHFLRQLESMNKQLKELAVIIDANSRVQAVGRPPQVVLHQHQWRRTPKTQTPTLLFPFNVLSLMIQAMLRCGNQAIGRWVKTGILARWLNRMRFWLMKRKRT